MSYPVELNASVHYVSHGTPVQNDGSQAFPPTCRAADVTEYDLHDWSRVGLCVKNPTGLFFHSVKAGGSMEAAVDDTTGSAVMTPGSWHWPDNCPVRRNL